MTDMVETCGKDLSCCITCTEVDADGVLGYTYGIQVLCADTIYYEHCDVDPNKELVEHIIWQLQTNQASGLHIEDVIEDMIGHEFG